jgi:hypothetical protein
LHQQQGVGFQLSNHFLNPSIGFKHTKERFPNNFIIKPIRVALLLFNKKLYKNPNQYPLVSLTKNKLFEQQAHKMEL